MLVAATDGVGTKLKVAIDSGILDTVGIDLVAMCVNDLIVQGAEPLFFLDYFATGRLDPAAGARHRRGHRRRLPAWPAPPSSAARPPKCRACITGGISTSPGLPSAPSSATGFCRAATWRRATSSSASPRRALHSNGFSLVRRIVAATGLALDGPAPFGGGGDARTRRSSTPTRIYVKPLLHALRTVGGIKALAHITGGGFVDNIPRVLPDALAARIDLGAVPVPPVFVWLAERGPVDEAEMLRTFNCGVGMVMVAEPAKADALAAALSRRRRDGLPPRHDRGPLRPAGGVRRASRPRSALMPRRRSAILISGRGSNMAALIEAAEAPDFPAEIALVLSSRPDAAGIDRALAAGVAAEPLDHAAFAGKAEFEAAIAARFEHHGIDLVCLAGFMRLLSDAFVETWRDRLINIHPSLLPAFAGLNTHARALDAGREDPRLHRPLSCVPRWTAVRSSRKRPCRSSTGDTAGLLAARVLAAEHRLYPFALSLVAGGKVRVVGERVVFEEGFSGDSAGDRLIAPRPSPATGQEPVASS